MVKIHNQLAHQNNFKHHIENMSFIREDKLGVGLGVSDILCKYPSKVYIKVSSNHDFLGSKELDLFHSNTEEKSSSHE